MNNSELRVFPDRANNGDWRVEHTDADGDGSCEVAIFSGPRAEERARLYSRRCAGHDHLVPIDLSILPDEVRALITATNPANSQAMAMIVTVGLLPRAASPRYRAVSRVCALSAISRAAAGTRSWM